MSQPSPPIATSAEATLQRRAEFPVLCRWADLDRFPNAVFHSLVEWRWIKNHGMATTHTRRLFAHVFIDGFFQAAGFLAMRLVQLVLLGVTILVLKKQAWSEFSPFSSEFGVLRRGFINIMMASYYTDSADALRKDTARNAIPSEALRYFVQLFLTAMLISSLVWGVLKGVYNIYSTESMKTKESVDVAVRGMYEAMGTTITSTDVPMLSLQQSDSNHLDDTLPHATEMDQHLGRRRGWLWDDGLRWILPLHPISRHMLGLTRTLLWDGRLSTDSRRSIVQALLHVFETRVGFTRMASGYCLATFINSGPHGSSEDEINESNQLQSLALTDLLRFAIWDNETWSHPSRTCGDKVDMLFLYVYGRYLKWWLGLYTSIVESVTILLWKVFKFALQYLIVYTLFKSYTQITDCWSDTSVSYYGSSTPTLHADLCCLHGLFSELNSIPGQPLEPTLRLLQQFPSIYDRVPSEIREFSLTMNERSMDPTTLGAVLLELSRILGPRFTNIKLSGGSFLSPLATDPRGFHHLAGSLLQLKHPVSVLMSYLDIRPWCHVPGAVSTLFSALSSHNIRVDLLYSVLLTVSTVPQAVSYTNSSSFYGPLLGLISRKQTGPTLLFVDTSGIELTDEDRLAADVSLAALLRNLSSIPRYAGNNLFNPAPPHYITKSLLAFPRDISYLSIGGNVLDPSSVCAAISTVLQRPGMSLDRLLSLVLTDWENQAVDPAPCMELALHIPRIAGGVYLDGFTNVFSSNQEIDAFWSLLVQGYEQLGTSEIQGKELRVSGNRISYAHLRRLAVLPGLLDRNSLYLLGLFNDSHVLKVPPQWDGPVLIESRLLDPLQLQLWYHETRPSDCNATLARDSVLASRPPVEYRGIFYLGVLCICPESYIAFTTTLAQSLDTLHNLDLLYTSLQPPISSNPQATNAACVQLLDAIAQSKVNVITFGQLCWELVAVSTLQALLTPSRTLSFTPINAVGVVLLGEALHSIPQSSTRINSLTIRVDTCNSTALDTFWSTVRAEDVTYNLNNFQFTFQDCTLSNTTEDNVLTFLDHVTRHLKNNYATLYKPGSDQAPMQIKGLLLSSAGYLKALQYNARLLRHTMTKTNQVFVLPSTANVLWNQPHALIESNKLSVVRSQLTCQTNCRSVYNAEKIFSVARRNELGQVDLGDWRYAEFCPDERSKIV